MISLTELWVWCAPFEGQRLPTVTGLLLIDRESAICDHLPTHEVAFQVLDNTQVRVNGLGQ